MSPTKTYVDAEAAAKAWALAQAGITALAGSKVFLGYNNVAGGTQLVVERAGGTADDGEAPLDQARISFSCWAASRRVASNLAYAVMSAAESMTGATSMGAAAVGHGARTALGPLFLTDQADEQASRYRYVVDIDFVIRAA